MEQAFPPALREVEGGIVYVSCCAAAPLRRAALPCAPLSIHRSLTSPASAPLRRLRCLSNKTVQDLWDNSVERSKLIAANEAAAARLMCMAQKKDADMTQFEERLNAAAAAVAQMRGGR